MIIGLIGKTGSGKTTIAKELEKLGYKNIVTSTTRPMRDGEVNGVDYDFMTNSEFIDQAIRNRFLESTSYEVTSGETWYYGTKKEALNEGDVIVLNPERLKAFKNSGVEMIVFYIKCSDMTILNRLRLRGDYYREIYRRMNADKMAFRGIENLSDISIKNENKMTAEMTARIINKIYKEVTI